MGEKILARTKHGGLTLDQLAEIQPGMARLMDEIARRYWYMYYAAKGGNWQFAAHSLGQVRSLFRVASTVRPKYAQDLETFAKERLEPIHCAIMNKDWHSFKQAFRDSVAASDEYHDKHGYAYIRFVLPPSPPEHLDLRPPEQLRKTR